MENGEIWGGERERESERETDRQIDGESIKPETHAQLTFNAQSNVQLTPGQGSKTGTQMVLITITVD